MPISYLLMLLASLPTLVLAWPLLTSLHELVLALSLVVGTLTKIVLWAMPAAGLWFGLNWLRKRDGWSRLKRFWRRPSPSAPDSLGQSSGACLDDRLGREVESRVRGQAERETERLFK